MSARTIKDGLDVLLKYEPKGEFSAEHDQVWFHGREAKPLSKADEAKLRELNWFFDDEIDAWSCFT